MIPNTHLKVIDTLSYGWNYVIYNKQKLSIIIEILHAIKYQFLFGNIMLRYWIFIILFKARENGWIQPFASGYPWSLANEKKETEEDMCIKAWIEICILQECQPSALTRISPVFKILDMTSFADDGQVVRFNWDLEVLKRDIEADLKTLVDWLKNQN